MSRTTRQVSPRLGLIVPSPKWKQQIEEPRIARLRRLIEEQYAKAPTGCGGSFGEILCHEIHSAGETFISLADKWGVSLPTLGELIWDHCCLLEGDPVVSGFLVKHDFIDNTCCDRNNEKRTEAPPGFEPG